MYKKIETVEEALVAAEMAEEQRLNGLYPQALIVLANHIRTMLDETFREKTYQVCYVQNGTRNFLCISDAIEKAEERMAYFKQHYDDVVILEKEVVCREIRYR